jgi:dihydroxyacetone kinase
MTQDFSLTDRTTWITVLTVVVAALANVFHTNLAAYVAPAATVAAGLVTAGVALAKHHYAAAAVQAAAYVQAAVTASTKPASAPTAAVAAPAAVS